MGDRYFITVECPHCSKINEDVYYAPTCGITTFECTCGHIVDLAEYTGIDESEASNKGLLERFIESFGNKDDLKIIVSRGAFGVDEDYLVEAILRAIAKFYGDEHKWPTKYGTRIETKIFMMNPYCWCEQDDCPWCIDKVPNFWYKPTDFKVWWYKYIGRSMEFNRKTTIPEAAEILSKCIKVGGAKA